MDSCTTTFAASAFGLAPNSGPTLTSCIFNAKTGLTIAQTALDGFGAIPGLGNAGAALQFGAGAISAGIAAATGDGRSAAAGYTGLGLVIANHEIGSYVSLAIKGTEVLPIAGNIISGLSAVNDIFGKNGVVASVSGCMNGAR